MVNQRQIVAVLTVIGSMAALGFAIYNLYISFQPNNSLKVSPQWEVK